MTTPVNIRDPEAGFAAKVSENGELHVAPLQYSAVYQVSSSDVNLHEVVPGVSNMKFVISAIILAQDKTNTDVDVTITEADDAGGANAVVLFSGGLTKSDRIALTALNVATGTAKWINLQHDSATATISATITGYYVDN